MALENRILGAETEFGITTPTDPALSPIVSSTHAVVAYAALREAARSRWDFQAESPLKDSRGFDLRRYRSAPVVDPNAMGVANVVLKNGARFYVDHAHPEYATPEVTDPLEAARHDAAGDLVLREATADIAGLFEEGRSVLEDRDPCPPIRIFKNNVDGKGASFGSHENYQYDRALDFEELTAALVPFFVTRQVLIGAGRMGRGQRGEEPGFQISQRADYFEQVVSLETTLNRGIVNTRDEPHANPRRFGRLHTIIGDANRSETATFLKLALTSMVVAAVEDGVDFSDLALADPVGELTAVSYDPTLTHRLELSDGRRLPALAILEEYLSRLTPALPSERRALDTAAELLGQLSRDVLGAADRLDWVAKWAIISRYLERGAPVRDAKLQAVDLQYADVDESRSLYSALVRSGRMRRLFSDEELRDAVESAPGDTRAWLRGLLVERFRPAVVSANWRSVALADPNDPTAEIRVGLGDGPSPAISPADLEGLDLEITLRALADAGLSVERMG